MGEDDEVEVVSVGRQLELVKQVGHPNDLSDTFPLADFRGSHAIGHTRLSTESRVDLTHSQPFWARGVADLATVHNGHITNYHKLRRIYELSGAHRELAGILLAGCVAVEVPRETPGPDPSRTGQQRDESTQADG